MAFSGGVYTLPGPALNTGEIVSASENNQFRNDVATAFNLTFLRNGTSTATANLPMGGYKLTGLGVATTSGDALSYAQAATVSTLTATGAAALNGGITVDSTAFTVADTTGNTSIAGTLAVTGVTTLTANPVLSGGTANGVAYLNGSKVLTTGSALAFDGTNLGIGTSSPSDKLEVAGNIRLSGGTNTLYTTASALILQSGTSGILQFANNNGTERMRIDSSGNLLVGLTAYVPALSNSVQIASSSSRQLVLRNASATAGKYWGLGPDNSANNIVVFNQNGAGVYMTDGATSWSSSSDEREKDIIEPIENAAEKVSTLRSVIGKYKTDKEGVRRSFLIAQDVKSVLPEAVNENQYGKLGLQYTDVIPLLVAAIKELKAELDAIKAEVAALKQGA